MGSHVAMALNEKERTKETAWTAFVVVLWAVVLAGIVGVVVLTFQ